MRNCAGCDVPLTTDNTYDSIPKWCRACWCAQVRLRRRTNPEVQEYDRKRAKTPKRRAHTKATTKRWRAENPDRGKAHSAVAYAVRTGKITKLPCLFCDTTENVHAHHRDYSRPLDVDWVCAKCHHRLHALEAAE